MKHSFIDHRCSLWDMGLTTVHLHQTEFELLGPPKRGGSCLVYEALKRECIGTKIYEHRVILKEFYPVSGKSEPMEIFRNQDGTLLISPGILESDNYQKRLKKFLDSYEIMLELGKQSDSMEHSVTPLSLTEAYGTWFLEETYDSGKLIFDYETPPSLKDFLTTMKNCLTVVGNLHQLGYYHLDIKPDNISCTKSGIIKLWDIDSLVKISELGTHQDFLWSDGFSAPEIESAAERPEDASYLIGPWTDIYSIAQLFCYYCFGRPIQYMELIHFIPELVTHIPRADYYITKEHYFGEYFSDEGDYPLFSKNAVYLLKHFLLRALSFRQIERYQTVEEALQDLSVIIERCDAQKLQPVDNFKELTSEEFSSFEQFEELELLEEFFDSPASEISPGIATITGETQEARQTLACFYATKHRLDYDTIIKVSSNNLELSFEIIFFFGQTPTVFNIQHVLADLKQYCRSHKLLMIIENNEFGGEPLTASELDVLDELVTFDNRSLHMLYLSEENLLGTYEITENEQISKYPFFEVRLGDSHRESVKSKKLTALKKSSENRTIPWKSFVISVFCVIAGVLLSKVPNHIVSQFMADSSASASSALIRALLILLTLLGPICCTYSAAFFYDFLFGQGNRQSLRNLANDYPSVFLAILAAANVLMLSTHISWRSIDFFVARFGMNYLDFIHYFVEIPEHIFRILLLLLLLGIPLLRLILFKKKKWFYILQNNICLCTIILSFVFLFFFTTKTREILLMYFLIFVEAWLDMRIRSTPS